MFMNRKGFTLIELIMVIVLLGLLAIVAIPKYYDLQQDAKLAADKGTVGGVRAGIYTYFAKNKAYPALLGGSAGACTNANPCFGTVLDQGGIQQDWTCGTTGLVYSGSSGTVVAGGIGTCTYTPATGAFLCA